MMFLMLGRFDCASSFSRRSSLGFQMGPTRFGFCCCERGLLSVFTISVPIHPSFAIQSCRFGCSLAQAQHPIPVPLPRDVPLRLLLVRPRLDRTIISTVFA